MNIDRNDLMEKLKEFFTKIDKKYLVIGVCALLVIVLVISCSGTGRTGKYTLDKIVFEEESVTYNRDDLDQYFKDRYTGQVIDMYIELEAGGKGVACITTSLSQPDPTPIIYNDNEFILVDDPTFTIPYTIKGKKLICTIYGAELTFIKE